MEKNDMDDVIEREMEKANRVARKINRARGYDDPALVAKYATLQTVVMASFRRALKPNATLGDFLQLLSTRFSNLAAFVKKASAQEPSIRRFESVIEAMIEVLMESIRKQDKLFALDNSFYRCFDLLAERPKTVKKLTSVKDIYFTDYERKRIGKSIAKFFALYLSMWKDVMYDKTPYVKLQIPDKFTKIAQQYRPADGQPMTDEIRSKRICAMLFRPAGDGLWEWDGDLFRYLQQFHIGGTFFNADAIAAKKHSRDMKIPFVDLLEKIISTDYGAALMGAITTGFTSPEMARAMMNDVEKEINNEVSRSDIAELERRVSDNRRTAEDLLKQLKLLGKELPPNSDKIKHVDDAIRRTEKCIRDMDECDYKLEQRKAEILPPREVAQKEKPIEEPPSVYRGCEKVHSKFYGQTLGQSIGKKIKVDRMGTTFSCPTMIADGKMEERSYRMKGKGQLEFLDTLLSAYKKNEKAWVQPMMKSAEWRPKYFNRGEARLFLEDGHIESEIGVDGAYTGRIKLSVPGKPKKHD